MLLLEVENIYRDHLDDLLNALKKKLHAIPTWTKQKHFLASQLELELIRQDYHLGIGHRHRLYLSGGIGASLLYQVPEKKKGKFAAYQGKFIRLVNVGSYKMNVNYYFKVLGDDQVKASELVHQFPREIRIKKINQPTFWAKVLHQQILQYLWVYQSYSQEVVDLSSDYSEKNGFKLSTLEYYLPKHQVSEPLFCCPNKRFSKGLYISYVEVFFSITNFDEFHDIQDVEFRVRKITSKYTRFIRWDDSQLSDSIIKSYMQIEGFSKESRVNHPELEHTIQKFLSTSHPPEIEGIQERLRPYFLWDQHVHHRIQRLLKQASVQSLDP